VRFLYVIDPVERWNVTKDTTFVFLAESQARSHDNYACSIQDLMVDRGKVYVACAPIEVNATQGHHWKYGKLEIVAAESFDAVFMRKDPPFDIDFFFSTHILSLIDEKKTFVFNRASGLREANEKLYILRFGDLMPETVVSADPAQLLGFCDKVGGDMVVKPLDGSGGMGIFRVTRGDLNTHSILETMTREGRRMIMAQRFLPASRDGDMRLIYLDGQALGAMKRVPRSDDLRGNIHVGGTCVKAEIGAREREICEKLAPAMRELGLWFAGLDIIGGFLTEVNVTSPTGIQEINRLYGTKIETHIIDFVERQCRERKRA
jgi:glutathione synthase